MTTWDSVNPSDSDYLTAADVDASPTGTLTATIESVKVGDFEKDDGTHTKHGVVAFVGKEKRWVLNRTNVILLRALWPTVEDSLGHKVTIMAEDTRFGREKTRGIRVKGSPDLTASLEVVVKLPKRKPVTRTLFPTGSTPAPSESCPQRDADVCRDCVAAGECCVDERGPS